MSYSNHSGGTLTIPSPTHVHHVDVTSAVRSLRRSLSRSPSKFRLTPQRFSTSVATSPLSPSDPQLPTFTPSQPVLSTTTPTLHTPSPLARPFPPSVKLSLRSATRQKVVPPRATSKPRTSPNSPFKRALSLVSDGGNSSRSSSSQESAPGQENGRGSISPTERRSLEKQSKEKPFIWNFEGSLPVNHALSRLGDGASDNTGTGPGTSSPLKRSDAIMNLDQASLGSPVAKRRSLHGSAVFGQDFNVFDHGPAVSSHFEVHEDSTADHETLGTSAIGGGHLAAAYAAVPRRSSSLRKSTLQQRHGDKTSWGRRQAAQELSSLAEVTTPVVSKNRPRLSLDQFMPPPPRDSPFSVQGALPNASVHLLHQHNQHNHQQAHQPHPLSRTMTTSSSNSSLADDSPTHLPVFANQTRPRLDFSKSLPLAAARPQATHDREEAESFATPANYKTVKPLPAAFMSTGLISKVNRHPEEPREARGLGRGLMPDTPCKKPINGFNTYPSQVPGSAIAKARHIRHSFGTPSTPFNPHGTPTATKAYSKGPIFGSAFRGHNRRGSFVSIDGEEINSSPDAKLDNFHNNDFELPPTPTKQVTEQPVSPSCNPCSMPPSITIGGIVVEKGKSATSSKSPVLVSSDDRDGGDGGFSLDSNESPPTSTFRTSSDSSVALPSFSRSRALRRSNLSSPSPLVPSSSTASLLSPRKLGFAKMTRVAPASPLERIDFMEKLSPRTPRETMLPPDPSGLSISQHKHTQQKPTGSSSSSMPPPATPTTDRDYFPHFIDRRLSVTPINPTFNAPDVDAALTSRFEKVELVGTGEFSQVYRVTQTSQPISTLPFLFGTPSRHGSPVNALPDRVYAVKKSRQPFQGPKDRLRRLQEVDVLRALGNADHVLCFYDSWEQSDHLYIQTEFCEEGSLDLFLSQVGRKGRLDDFRIWKILLELGQGLKHIHDAGFIHLDLKPANILITFEGLLKIGDFGMATPWPARAGIEGEGDREYIGPEILLGRYDKPADIFAFGLIMLEIAGNVQLPDNGPTWQRLRSGDMSDVPSLTWSTASAVARDATGIPLEESSDVSMDYFGSDEELETTFGSPSDRSRKRHSMPSTRSFPSGANKLFGCVRRGELPDAPDFMKDQYHDHALDRLVKWMISPSPDDRPTVQGVLEVESVKWVEARRRAGATVFEGNWGPADVILVDDTEMLDV